MTATAQHTPAPWGIGDGGMHVYYLDPAIESGDAPDDHENPSHDSVVANAADMGCMSGIPDEERLANIRLIACAPDLLESLTDMLAQADERHPCSECPRCTANRERARQLIAKAKGGSVQYGPNPYEDENRVHPSNQEDVTP